MACRVVCVSRTLAAGGEDVARAVSQRLGFRYVDEEIVEKAASKVGIDPGEVAEAEHRQPLVARILDAMGASSGMELMGIAPGFVDPSVYSTVALAAHTPAYLTHDRYRALIQEVVQETAQAGAAVIVAHAAAMTLSPSAEILRVFITASPEVRAQRLVGAGELDSPQAAKAVQKSDKDRSYYFRDFCNIKEELPTHYDLVINTDNIDLASATDIVVGAATR